MEFCTAMEAVRANRLLTHTCHTQGDKCLWK